MVAGLAKISFILHDCQTLKEKRSIIKRLVERTRNRFNAAVCESDYLDSPKQGQIGVVVVSTDWKHANSLLDHIIDFIEKMYLVDITEIKIEPAYT